MAIEFDIHTAKGVSDLNQLSTAWDRNREKVVSATKAYEAQTKRLGKALLRNQEYKRSLDSLSAAYATNQKQISALSTVTKTLVGKVKVLEADLSALNTKLAATAKKSKVVTKEQYQLRSAFRGTAGALGGLWLAYGDILPMMAAFATVSTAKAAVQQGAAFSYTTKYLNILNESAGDTSVSLDTLRESLLGMEDLRHTPEELAQGMKSFAKAGVSSVEALDNLAEMSRFATLAEVELSYAIEKNIGVANAFGETYADTANMIFAAANSSATSVTDMMTAISQATSLGVVSGLELKDTLTGLAAAARSGIFGSKSGTSLRTSILRLQTPTSKFNKLLKKMGKEFSAFNSDGSAKDLITLFTDLSIVLQDLSAEDRIKLLREGLGLRALKGGAAVLRELNEGLAKLRERIDGSTEGVTLLQRTADDLSDETLAKWEKLKNIWSGILVSAGGSTVANGILDLVTTASLGWEAVFAKLRGDTLRLDELQAIISGVKSSSEAKLQRLEARRKVLNKQLQDELILEDTIGTSSAHRVRLELEGVNKRIQAIRKLKQEKRKAADVKLFGGEEVLNKGPKLDPNIAKKAYLKADVLNAVLVGKSMTDSWLLMHKWRKKYLKEKKKGAKKEANIAIRTVKETEREIFSIHHSNKEKRIYDLRNEYEEKKKLLKQYNSYDMDAQELLTKWYEEKQSEILDGHKDMIAEMKNAWDDYQDYFKGEFSSTLSGFFKGEFEDIGEAWDSLWDSMLDKLTDVLTEMAVNWAASQVSSMFQGWKFHEGLWSLEDDELPAILQKGEMVIPAEHAEQIRDNLGGIGTGMGNAFDAVVAGTSLMDIRGWEDEFSDHLSSEYKADFAMAIASAIQSGNPLSGILGVLGPQGGIQNISAALAETGLDMMGLHGSWSDTGFMIGSFLSTMLMGGPLATVTGLNNLGGFVGAIAADMLGDAFNMREFESVRDDLENNYNLSPAQQAQAVQSMETFQSEWGRLSPVQDLATNLHMMSSFTGANLGLNDLLAAEKEKRNFLLEKERAERQRSWAKGWEDTFGDPWGDIPAPGTTGSQFTPGIDDIVGTWGAEGEGIGAEGHEGGGPEGDQSSAGDIDGGTSGLGGYSSGGVVRSLFVPEGDDGFAGLKFGEGVVPVDTMKRLDKAFKNAGLDDVVKAIQRLSSDVRSANYAVAKNTKDTAKILKKIDAIGLGVRA